MSLSPAYASHHWNHHLYPLNRNIKSSLHRISSMSQPDAHPFRFLDLPKELRLMVYERLPTTIVHRSFQGTKYSQTLTLVRPCISGLAILATCRERNDEASAIIQRRLTALKKQPLRIPSTIAGIDALCLLDLFLYLAGPGPQPRGRLLDKHPETHPDQLVACIDRVADALSEVQIEIALRDESIEIARSSLKHEYKERIVNVMSFTSYNLLGCVYVVSSGWTVDGIGG